MTARIGALIRQYIIEMRPGYEPGNRINPRDMAREFGVSETPMKQALQELATHGLVEVFPRRGTYVGKPSRRDISELIEMRIGLEATSLRFAGNKLEDVLSGMLACVRLCEEALEKGDSETYRSSDAKFHRLIIQASGNRRLDQVYESLTGRVQIFKVYNPPSGAAVGVTGGAPAPGRSVSPRRCRTVGSGACRTLAQERAAADAGL